MKNCRQTSPEMCTSFAAVAPSGVEAGGARAPPAKTVWSWMAFSAAAAAAAAATTRAPLCCVANGLCKPGDLLIRPHYTPLSFREPRRMNPTTLQVQIKVAKGCLSTVLVGAPFDHVYLDSRVQCLALRAIFQWRAFGKKRRFSIARPD